MVDHMTEVHGVSHRQACKAVQLPRSSQCYQPQPKEDGVIVEALQALVDKHPAIGFLRYDIVKKSLSALD